MYAKGGGNVQLSSKIAVVCAVIREVALESIFISGENLGWERVRTVRFWRTKRLPCIVFLHGSLVKSDLQLR